MAGSVVPCGRETVVFSWVTGADAADHWSEPRTRVLAGSSVGFWAQHWPTGLGFGCAHP